jgi:DNA-binding CsgD family transcriptional regulator
VRSQLKSIFGKLGVSKQQDVVRLLLNSGLNRRL